MQLDRDGILSILLGLALLLVSWGAEYYFFVKDPVGAVVAVVKDLVIGGVAGIGLLLILVGILFIVAW